MASVGSWTDSLRTWLALRQTSYRVPPCGLGITLVRSRRNSFRLGTDDAPNFGPETATSTLKYAAALASCASCCSPHSVEPIKPSSSPSQLPMTMVRLGFQPDFSNSPIPCTASNMAAVPLLGSTAPYTQASRWLPATTHSSGDSLPRTRPITSQMVRNW